MPTPPHPLCVVQLRLPLQLSSVNMPHTHASQVDHTCDSTLGLLICGQPVTDLLSVSGPGIGLFHVTTFRSSSVASSDGLPGYPGKGQMHDSHPSSLGYPGLVGGGPCLASPLFTVDA